jgi:hypothetical protein
MLSIANLLPRGEIYKEQAIDKNTPNNENEKRGTKKVLLEAPDNLITVISKSVLSLLKTIIEDNNVAVGIVNTKKVGR